MIAYCFCWNGAPDWEAIGAIGQVLGAIATFLAVLVALRVRKAKLRIKFTERPSHLPDDDRIQVHIVNDSEISIKLNSFGFRVGNEKITRTLSGKVSGLEVMLEPHNDKNFSIAHMDIAKLAQDNYIGNQTISLFIIDSKWKQHLVQKFAMDIEKYAKRRT